MQTPQGYSSSAPYVGAGAPSSMYISVPPYGSSLFNQTSKPPYDAPFSGSSNYHNYENRMSGGSPFRQLHLSGPTPYSSGALVGNGTCSTWCSVFQFAWCPFFFHESFHISLDMDLALQRCIFNLLGPCGLYGNMMITIFSTKNKNLHTFICLNL